MFRPVLLLALSFIFGLMFNSYAFLLYPFLAVFIVFFSYCFYRVRKSRKDILITLLMALLVPVLFLYGREKADESQQDKWIEGYLSENEDEPHSIKAAVRDRSDKDGGVRLRCEILEIDGHSAEGCQILLYLNKTSCIYGDIIRTTTMLNTFLPAMNDGEFDAKAYYNCRNIYCQASPEEIEITGREKGLATAFVRGLYRIRKGLTDNLDRVFEKRYETTVEAMLTGDRYGLDSEVADSFKKAGFAHILAISGLHISILGLGLFALLRKIGHSLAFSVSISLGMLGIYTIFSGTQVSCQRAVIMSGLALMARVFGRKYDGLSALGLAALVILIREPRYLTDSSFLLSFAAGLGIIFSMKAVGNTELLIGFNKSRYKEAEKAVSKSGEISVLSSFWHRTIGNVKKKNRSEPGKSNEDNRLIRFVKGLLFTVCLQLVMLPVQLSFYYSFCPYTIILNIILLPAMSVLLILGLFIGVFAKNIGFAAHLAAHPVRFILDVYQAACDFASSLPFGKIVIGKPGLLRLLIYVAILLLFYFLLMKTGRLYTYWFLLLLILPLAIRHNTGTEIYQLYAGQGDCGVILSEGKAILVDCGSTDKDRLYENSVEKFLNYHGFVRPDIVFLSHSDSDHTNGFASYLAEASEKKLPVLVIPKLENEEDFSAILACYENSPELVQRLSQGERFETAGLSFTVLYPDKEHLYDSENENSMVLHLSAGDFTMLYTGDIPAEAEPELLSEMNRLSLKTEPDCLKVAHHGSRFSTSEEFLTGLKPKKAVISCGIHNNFHHPAEETLKRLDMAGCEVYVTKDYGQIRIK